MENTIVYLTTGQQARLVKELPTTGFLVEPIFTGERYYGEDVEGYEFYGQEIFVTEILSAPPMAKLEQTYKDLCDRVDERQRDVNDLQETKRVLGQEVRKLVQQQTDLNRCIINRSEFKAASTIALFEKGEIAPTILGAGKMHSYKISTELSVITGQEKSWVYKWYGDQWSCASCIDPDYGFLFDATEDVLMGIALERQKSSMLIKNYVLNKTPDEWLCDSLLARKRKNLQGQRLMEKGKIEKKIVELQEQIKVLDALEDGDCDND